MEGAVNLPSAQRGRRYPHRKGARRPPVPCRLTLGLGPFSGASWPRFRSSGTNPATALAACSAHGVKRPSPRPRACRRGGVPEWSIGAVSKTVVRVSVPWVRIPPPPPYFLYNLLINIYFIKQATFLPPFLPPSLRRTNFLYLSTPDCKIASNTDPTLWWC